MPLIAVTDATFESQVCQSKLPVLVDFGTDWCAPCKQIEPILSDLAGTFAGQVKFVKVNIDQAPTVAARMGVRGIPALFLFVQGKPVANRVGAASSGALHAWIEAAI